MLYQIVHTHTHETCPARSTEETKRIANWWQSLKKTPGVKVLAGYVSPIDHIYYITVETDDYPALARALGALNTYGTGHIIPVLTLDQAVPMAESGAFRASK
jgi:hypothetical protein